MSKPRSPAFEKSMNWGAVQIAGLYLLLGCLWILFSDQIAASVARSQEMLAAISLYKGWGYVVVTALLLYWLISRRTAALRASEEQLQRVVNSFPALISYLDANRYYRFTNTAYEEWFSDAVEGKHMQEVLGEKAYQTISKYVDQALMGETVTYETAIPYRNGERFVNATYVPDIGARGQVKGFFALVQDMTGQKQAEEEFRLWADAFEGCAHGIAIGDPYTSRIVVCNPAFASLLKCRVEDVIGSAILSIYAPADHEHVRHGIERADQIGHSRFEAQMIRMDGSAFPVQMDLVSVLSEQGELLHRVATAQDISERKAIDEKLKESEAKYRTLVEHLPAITYIAGPDQYIGATYVSPQMEALGFDRDAWLADPEFWFKQIHPEDQARVLSELERFQARGESFRAEYRLRLPNGESRWFHDEAVRIKDRDGKPILIQGFMLDITERKQAEEKLLYQARLLEQINDAVITSDLQLVITGWNPAAERIYGWEAEEVLGQRGEIVLGTEFFSQQTRSEALQELRQSGEFFAEVSQLRKDGSRVYIETRTAALRSESGSITGYISVNRDITERKQTEERVRKSEERYRYLFENNPHSMWVYDRNTLAFLDVNEAAIAKYGYSRQEFLNMRIVDIRPPEELQRLIKNLARPRQPLEHSEGWKHRLKDGTLIDVEISSHTVDVEGHDSVLVIAQDITERKRVEEALRRSEALLLQTGKMAKVGGWELDLQTMTLVWSLETYHIHELDSSFQPDVQGAIDFYAPEARPIISEAVQRAIEEARPFDLELPLITAKGRSIWVRAIGQAEFENGKGTRIFGTFQDITERKQAEENLRRFELLSEHSRDIILFMARQDGRILEANAAAAQAYGYSRDELLTLNVQDLRAAGTLELTADQMAQADDGGILFETVHRRRDGSTFPVEVSSQGATISGVRTLISIVRDISERKQAQEALQKAHDELEIKVRERTAALSQANSLLQALMDHMPDHIYFKDTQCRFIRNSKSQATSLGLKDPSEAVGKTDFDFFPHAAKAYAEEQEVMRTGKPMVDFEEWVVWPDGHETWVSTTKVPLQNAEEETIGIFGISRDITERKKAEQAIRELNANLEKQAAKLQAANKELEAFSYSVSHDLRAPLRAIDGYTRILAEDYEAILDAEGKRICGVISAEARRMGRLIDDLLAFSRLGRKQMYTSKIDMKAMVVSVFEELVQEQDRERIDFQVTKLPPIKGDSSLIRQVWFNLLANAVKFTSKKAHAVVEVGSRQTPEENIYYVRDNGAGFDMEYANKLFGVFQRLHGESEFEGTGVGLAIVQRIIRRHGGQVWAEGAVDRGATFYFALPRKEIDHE